MVDAFKWPHVDDECKILLAKVLALPWEQAHQDYILMPSYSVKVSCQVPFTVDKD